jgi:glycine C-acetyltransferase
MLTVAKALRLSRVSHQIDVIGAPSPVVPIIVPNTGVARIAVQIAFEQWLAVNIAEFPVVPVDAPRFRFQVMSDHTVEQAHRAADITSESR